MSALEITIVSDKALWNQGQVPHFPEAYACIQGSDAHEPQEIGRRPIYVDITTIGVEELRLAFRQHESRIRFDI